MYVIALFLFAFLAKGASEEKIKDDVPEVLQKKAWKGEPLPASPAVDLARICAVNRIVCKNQLMARNTRTTHVLLEANMYAVQHSHTRLLSALSVFLVATCCAAPARAS